MWALVGYLQAVNGDVDLVGPGYELPRQAVEAALAYYRKHKAIIAARLEENAAFFA